MAISRKYAYQAKNMSVGDLASQKTISLTPAAQRKKVEAELDEIKKNPIGQPFQRNVHEHHQREGLHTSKWAPKGPAPVIKTSPAAPARDEEIASRECECGRPQRRSQPYTARLLIDCADQPGIVAAVSGFLFEQGANIVSSHQYSSDPIGGRFYLRTEFFLEGLAEDRERFRHSFEAEVAQRFAMEWEIRYWGERQRVAILVSRYDHCLVDLLWRWRRGELDADVVGVISNHPDLAEEAQAPASPSTTCRWPRTPRSRPRSGCSSCLRGNVDLVVLARYMQILSGEFLDRLGAPVDQHPPLVPACLRGRRPLPAGARARRQADRRHRPLRDRRARRWPDHRAGCGPRRPSSERARAGTHRSGHRATRARRAPCRCTSKIA